MFTVCVLLVVAAPSLAVRLGDEKTVVELQSADEANATARGPADDFLYAGTRVAATNHAVGPNYAGTQEGGKMAQGLKKFCKVLNDAQGLTSTTTQTVQLSVKCRASSSRPTVFELVGEMMNGQWNIRSKMTQAEFDKLVRKGLKDDGTFKIRLGYCDADTGNNPACVKKAKSAGFGADSSTSFYLTGKIMSEEHDVGRDIGEFFTGQGAGWGGSTYRLLGKLDRAAGIQVASIAHGGHDQGGMSFVWA